MTLFRQIIKPMLAETSEPFNSNSWVFEVKFDGTRTICYIDTKKREVRLLNRRLKFFQSKYPELQKIWKDVTGKKVILDGEVCIFEKGRPNFYKLAEREHTDDKTRIEFLSKIIPATYVVFDILHKDGEDLINRPLSERKKILEQTVRESSRVLISRYIVGNGRKFFNEVKKKGLEGIMAKRLDSPYLIGKRSRHWLKIKTFKTLDCVIGGYTTGTGKRGELLGSLIVGCFYQEKLKHVGKVGTGFDEKQLRKLLENLEKLKIDKCPFEEEPDLKLPPGRRPVWVKPKLVCEVKFMNLSENLIMRAPVFMRLREDKFPRDCTLEV
jgi:DNA ligase D-like protein (predicted ligase)